MTASVGLNMPADARLAPQFGALLGAKWLRVVLKPEYDLTPWILDAHGRGMSVLGVIARESLAGPYDETAALYKDRYGDLFEALQPGNEPDHYSPSSWTMLPDDLNNLLAAFNQHFPDAVIVGPGLVSGNPHYLDAVDLDLVDYVALHPYGRRPNDDFEWQGTPGNFGTVSELLDAYDYHDVRYWITEIGVSSIEVSQTFQARYCEAVLTTLARDPRVENAMWFASDDAQVAEFGLYDDQGNPKPAAAAFIRAAGAIPIPDPEPIPMALPTEVFKRMWQSHLHDAEFHPSFGIEKFWMEHYKELGAVTDISEYRQGKNAYRTFVGGVIHWHDDTGAKIA
jgi:hypothetical protein